MDQPLEDEIRDRFAASLWRANISSEARIHGLSEALLESFPEATEGPERQRLLGVLGDLSAVTLQLALGQYEAATWILHRHVAASVSRCLAEALGEEHLPEASTELSTVARLLGLSNLQQQLASLAVLEIVDHEDTALAETFSRWEREMPPSRAAEPEGLARASREVAGQSATSLLLSVVRMEFKFARWYAREAERSEEAVSA